MEDSGSGRHGVLPGLRGLGHRRYRDRRLLRRRPWPRRRHDRRSAGPADPDLRLRGARRRPVGRPLRAPPRLQLLVAALCRRCGHARGRDRTRASLRRCRRGWPGHRGGPAGLTGADQRRGPTRREGQNGHLLRAALAGRDRGRARVQLDRRLVGRSRRPDHVRPSVHRRRRRADLACDAARVGGVGRGPAGGRHRGCRCRSRARRGDHPFQSRRPAVPATHRVRRRRARAVLRHLEHRRLHARQLRHLPVDEPDRR